MGAVLVDDKLRASQPNIVGREFKPRLTIVLISGIEGKVVPLSCARERSYVATIAVPFGQFIPLGESVSAEESTAKMTSTPRTACIRGVKGIFCRSSPPSTRVRRLDFALGFVEDFQP